MTHHDLIVVGTGSGNRVIDDSFADLDVAIVEQEQRFGGTCLNVGCIPTKMLAYTGEVVDTVTDAGRFGVAAHLDGMRWHTVRDRVFGRLDPSPATAERAATTPLGSPSTPDTHGSPARARCRSTGLGP
jgi:mycothione reductase